VLGFFGVFTARGSGCITALPEFSFGAAAYEAIGGFRLRQ
jgi:hypothetical protein